MDGFSYVVCVLIVNVVFGILSEFAEFYIEF